MSGNGLGVVVLKRMADALADGDTIHAVIKGSAINNDGSLKVGYTAPSEEGQAQVIKDALTIARVTADTVTYVETHGTGTALGDPIEIAALTQAFRASTEAKDFCAIGSVKTNIGHLDVAAGIAILQEAGGLVTTANPPEDWETALIEDVRLGSRLYLAVRPAGGNEMESGRQGQERTVREVWRRVRNLDYSRPGA